MSEEREYQLREIVWARIQNYPIWPAKVFIFLKLDRPQIATTWKNSL